MARYKQKLCSIGRVRKYIDQDTAFTLYRSLLLPVLDYCSIVYMTASKNSLQKVQKIQNSACRIILFADRRTHVKEMHEELKLLYMDERAMYNFCVILFKCLNNMAPEYLKDLLTSRADAHNINTRAANEGELHVPRARTRAGECAFYVRGPSTWNTLPLNLRIIANLNEFKREIIDYLLSLRINDV